MSSALVALILGTVLAVGALAFVLYPLFFGTREPLESRSLRTRAGDGTPAMEHAVAALREVEFDRATGKLSEADYAQLKDRYTRAAVVAMRDAGSPAIASPAIRPDDDVEAAVRAYRAMHLECSSCGPRPEHDAIYCSTCGRYLRASCEHCGARVEEVGARFCAACGHKLAA